MPVKAGGQTFGILSVASSEIDHFTHERVSLLTAIVDGLGALLQNASLAEDLQVSSQEMAMVDRVSRILGSTLNIEGEYERFFEEVKTLLDFDQAGINLFNEDRSELTIAYLSEKSQSLHRQGEPFAREGTMSARVLESGRTVVLGNREDDREFWGSERLLNKDLRSVIVAPLISGEKVFGTFFLSSRQTAGFGERQRVVVERLAAQIAPAVENARLYAQRVRTEQALRESEVRSRAIMETAPDGILTVSSDGLIEAFNSAAERIFGYALNEVTGLNVNSLISEPDPGMNDGYHSWKSAIDLAQVTGIGPEVEGRRKDGSVFPMEIRGEWRNSAGDNCRPAGSHCRFAKADWGSGIPSQPARVVGDAG